MISAPSWRTGWGLLPVSVVWRIEGSVSNGTVAGFRSQKHGRTRPWRPAQTPVARVMHLWLLNPEQALALRPMVASDIVDLIRRVKLRAEAVGLRCVLHPPVSPARLAALEARFGPLPQDLTLLIQETAAIELGGNLISFADDLSGHGAGDGSPWALFPACLVLGRDNAGHAVLLDLAGAAAGRVPILALLHKPAIAALVAPDLRRLLQTIGLALPRSRDELRDGWSPFDAILGEIRMPRLVLRGEVKPVTRQAALTADQDTVLIDWARSLPDRARIVDFRGAAPQAMFCWGFPARYIAYWRHPSELLFGLLLDPKPRSLWGFITGFDESREHRRAARLVNGAAGGMRRGQHEPGF